MAECAVLDHAAVAAADGRAAPRAWTLVFVPPALFAAVPDDDLAAAAELPLHITVIPRTVDQSEIVIRVDAYALEPPTLPMHDEITAVLRTVAADARSLAERPERVPSNLPHDAVE